jgi:glycerophosphoryl diester phosphodiesterase
MMIMGHRGAAALEPENTLRSIAKAIHIGVDAVEIDVHLTADKKIVVIHDDTVDRTTNGSGAVSSLPFEEIRRLDAGKGERIPTLQEVIDLVRGKVRLVVELKQKGTEGPVAALIRENGLLDDAYVISFWHRLVKTAKVLEHRLKTGVLFVGCPVDTSVATQAAADALVMRYAFVDGEFVDLAHRDGLKVFIWNIDELHLIAPYVDMGVDGIGSNDPRILVDFFS